MTGFLARAYAFKFFDAFILIFPLYTVMFADAGLTPTQIAICLTAWSLVGFSLQIPSGVIADRRPRRTILAVAQLSRGAGFAIWLAYPHFWGFCLGLVLWGAKSAFTNGTFEALLFDALKEAGQAQSYTRLYGRMRAVQSSAVLAAALGAAVAARWGYGTILAASLVSVGVASLTAFSLPPTAPAASASGRGYFAHLRLGLAAAFRSPPVLSILVFSAILLALGSALQEFWPIFGAKVGLSRPIIAVFVGGQSLLEALASLVAFRLAALPRQAFHLLFALAGALLLAASAIFTAPAMLLLAAYSGLMKLIAVVFEGRLQHAIGSESRATVGSAKSLLSQIGVTALYLSFGPIAEASSYRIAFMACGLAGFVIALGYMARAAVRSEAPEAAA